ncbi:MAG: hypothetical protein U1F53_20725 [Burkholderiaceae bacterium]
MFSQTSKHPLRIGNITFQTAPLEPAENLPQLLAIHERSTEPFTSEAGSFTAFTDPDNGIFVLCYFNDSDCLSFVFDAWSKTTRDHLVHARNHAGIVIALLKPKGTTRVGGGTSAFWAEAVNALDSYRAGARRRGPLDYVRALRDFDVVTRQLAAVRTFVRPDEGIARPMTVTLMVERKHMKASGASQD